MCTPNSGYEVLENFHPAKAVTHPVIMSTIGNTRLSGAWIVYCPCICHMFFPIVNTKPKCFFCIVNFVTTYPKTSAEKIKSFVIAVE